jgi:hypothetical protein
VTDTTTDRRTTYGGTGHSSTDTVPESGIADADGFDAFVRAYPPAQLFTQFFAEPFEYLLERVAGHLQDREPGAVLERLTITAPPVPHADGHPDYDDPAPDADDPRLVLTRAALYAPFVARVSSPSKGPEVVQGALTCVLGNMNQPDNQVVRSWMDVDDFGLNRLTSPDAGQYQERMLSVGQWVASDYPPGSPEREELGDGVGGGI